MFFLSSQYFSQLSLNLPELKKVFINFSSFFLSVENELVVAQYLLI